MLFVPVRDLEAAFNIQSNLSADDINKFITFTRDKTGKATFDEMLTKSSEFHPHKPAGPLILNYSSDTVWVKLDVNNNENKNIEWILEYRYPLIDSIELYSMTTSGVKIMKGGDSFAGKEKIIKSRTFAFPVTSPPGDSILMLRIQSEGSLNINLHAWGNEKFQLFLREDLLLQGLFFGIMMALLIYNLLIFFLVGHRSYIYIVFYIITISLYSATNNGFAQIYFWPDSVVFAQRAHPIFIFSAALSIILFTSSFLSLDRHYPRIYKFSLGLSLILALLIPSSFVLHYRIITQISVLFVLFAVFFMLGIALFSIKYRKREAIYYISSYIFFGAGAFLQAIRAYGSTHETYYEVWGMQTGATLMVLLLSLGIADKIRSLRNEKEKALSAKQEIENRFQILFDNSHDSIIIMQHKQIVYANKALQQLTGYSVDELKEINLDTILQKTKTDSKKTNTGSYQFSGRLQTNTDNKIDVIISVAEANIGGDSAQMFIITDISTLKNAEETIRIQYEEIETQYEEMAALNTELSNNHVEILEAHEKLGSEKEQLAATIKSITEAVITIDISRRINLLNPEAERLIGMPQEQIIGKEFSTIFTFRSFNDKEPFPDPAMSLIQDQQTIIAESPVLFSNQHGEKFILELTGNPVITVNGQLSGGVIILHDITEKYKLEQETLRVRKIDSISLLAGGIAHDFNNLLTAILGNLSIAKYSKLETDEYPEFLERIEQAAAKAIGLTQQLLTFSKGGDPVKRPESIRQLLQEDMDFMLTGSKIKGSLDIEKNLMNVEVDINQFNQVIQNLIINAIHSMPEGGNLHISAENVGSIKSLPLQTGRYVKISIADSGIGIPEENLDKIFDPYFTTKKTGSGLGLASCYSIIKRHGGYITVQSSPGEGSTFNVYLPASEKELPEKPLSNIYRDFSGHDVLLIDDDSTLREVVGLMLKSLKLDVITSGSGEEGVEVYKDKFMAGKPFDLVVTDLIMPGGIGGDAAIKKILEINPDVLSIAMSGFSNDPIMSNYKEYGFSACLSKPFDLNSLAAVISKLLKVR